MTRKQARNHKGNPIQFYEIEDDEYQHLLRKGPMMTTRQQAKLLGGSYEFYELQFSDDDQIDMADYLKARQDGLLDTDFEEDRKE